MVDHRPPVTGGDEREVLQALLQFQRESVVRKVEGLDDEAARRRLVDSDTTLLWLVQHLSYAESIWVVHRFADEGEPQTDPHGESLDAAVDRYRATWAQVDGIVAGATDLGQTCRRPIRGERPTLRWILAHLLEETARHAGHADILRELLDGETGR